jgi:hypothetical protein
MTLILTMLLMFAAGFFLAIAWAATTFNRSRMPLFVIVAACSMLGATVLAVVAK